MSLNSIGSSVKAHPIRTSLALALTAFVSLKVAHEIPLRNLDSRYTASLRENNFELDELVKAYQRINPADIAIELVGENILNVMNQKGETQFVITCPGMSSGVIHSIRDIPDKKICLIRDSKAIIFPVFGVALDTSQTKSALITGHQINLPFNNYNKKYQSI